MRVYLHEIVCLGGMVLAVCDSIDLVIDVWAICLELFSFI